MARPIAVLTGDIIDSRRIRNRTQLHRVLDAVLAELASRYGGRGERYRGDGLQLALPDACHAVTAAIALRAALIQHSTAEQRWDARLAVAVGTDDWTPDQRLAECDSEVFVRSGRALDALDDAHLSLVLPSSAATPCVTLLTRFIDELIDGWSPYSAEISALMLARERTQQALAEQLGISQPSVHKRLKAARWALLNDYLTLMHERLGQPEMMP